MNNTDTPKVYYYEDAIDYIQVRTNVDRDTIERVLDVELDYMRSIGLVEDFEEVKNND